LGWRQAPPLASYEAGTVVNLARLGQAEHGDDQPAADKPPRTVGPWTVTTPIGKQVVVAADSPKFTLADGPGVYEVQSSAGLQRLTVDVPADESKTAPMGAEALETLGVRLANETEKAAPTAAERQALQVRELEARQQLWRWCLVAALGCTLMETWYAGRVARRESVG
jgi:hypothetical protein